MNTLYEKLKIPVFCERRWVALASILPRESPPGKELHWNVVTMGEKEAYEELLYDHVRRLQQWGKDCLFGRHQNNTGNPKNVNKC